MTLPDPNLFPDPYPSNHFNSLPPLSSAGSSSTRSSAYTTSGSLLASSDSGHIHVASGDEDPSSSVGVGITSDDFVQMLASSTRSLASKPLEQSRSRSSSNSHEHLPPPLHQKPSYDMSWQPVDEREELGLTDDETDDDVALLDSSSLQLGEERTSAAVIADEGRGLIVQAEIGRAHV